MQNTPPPKFFCAKCPAYCCSIYAAVDVTDNEIKRFAKFLKLTFKQAYDRHTKPREENRKGRMLRQKVDPLLTGNKCCSFLNTETRQCMIYEARPKTCREYPYGDRCGYYEMLDFERRHHDDPQEIVLVQLTKD